MAALASDFHVLTSRVTAGNSAVFFAIRYIAQARYVRAFLALLICHFTPSFPNNFSTFDVVPVCRANQNESRGFIPVAPVLAATSSRLLHADVQTLASR